MGAGPTARQSARLDPAARAFLEAGRVGHLATADRGGAPHVVPVCYALSPEDREAAAYITLDAKPKRGDGGMLRRVANLLENPRAALVVDRYDEDWRRLGWVMLRGPAEILADGAEHDAAQGWLCARYRPLAAMAVAALPVIAIRVARVTQWGVV
ncbi:MAG: TIGR03668 family PPOX class F420-dependent oxidoreductase [Rhodospirillales bacterium]|nr:TIGR03668 family PPOX class F420-dependent oxidoreductase [Rhodospirillales bacterium]